MYPVMLSGAGFEALVVGGGAVAERKTRALLEGGVSVTVVAPEISPGLRQAADGNARLVLLKREYESSDLDRATIVIAATDDATLNRSIGDAAGRRAILVNVADDPDAGNFVTPSVHRSGDLTIAVSSGRTPAAAAAIRAELGRRFDGRYAQAIRSLRTLRDRLLGAGQREDWKRASRELVGDEFCAEVEQGNLEQKVTSWR
jgi:precorrin-2 dehydrogenase/sirohydrochlorin ferrochelatase